MNMIELNRISYAYPGEPRLVLEQFSLSLPKGKCLALRGDNGAGKTTLFRILAGLAFPLEGSYCFDGQEITEAYLKNNRNAKSFHKRIGYLFQNPDVMLFNGTVYDEVAFGPRQMGLPEEEVAKRTGDCLDLFGLKNLQDKAPYHLSGGQKKRVALAAVMALNPEVLLLDEPLAGLDSGTREMLTEFLGQLKNAGKTLILATHDDGLTESLAEEVRNMRPLL